MKMRYFVLMALMSLAFAVPRADASFKVTLSNDGASTTITDDLVGDGLSGTAGVIQSTIALGDYSLVVTIANSKGTLGSAGAPAMQVTVGTAIYTPTGVTQDPNLVIEVTDTDFNPNDQPLQGYEIGLGGSTVLGGSTTYTAFSSTTNNEFAYDDQIGGTLSGSGLGFSQIGGGLTPADASTSLTLKIVLKSKAIGDVSQFTASLKAVPEPATLTVWSMLGSVVGLGAMIRRRYC